MSHWSDYYAQGVTADLYIRNLCGQREFLLAILDSGVQKVLEVGAGTGTMSIFLSHCGREVTTLDNDPAVLGLAQSAKAAFGGHNQLVKGDAFKLPFAADSFGLVFHQGLLEHFSNRDIHTLLQEHLRVAPVVVFSVPNSHYPQKDLGNERLMNKTAWERLLAPYRVEMSCYYSPKFIPRWYLPWRLPVQYMAKVTRR
ncbi:hypothetical protein A2V68_00650 [candidate division Kazan bacterium RBG_13_50_9]|uniref:Methyltransferase domain-containing protein n=1 Tax=candidate division Kazan bacterium RBG_13_50_9 TaxID=1798535 RepID=A0A1F4NS44_UNCK3|nr:MAG: hypothetical protein A2V68_00650 [candidate division Kazan bacterium RBG_13_50_9]